GAAAVAGLGVDGLGGAMVATCGSGATETGATLVGGAGVSFVGSGVRATVSAGGVGVGSGARVTGGDGGICDGGEEAEGVAGSGLVFCSCGGVTGTDGITRASSPGWGGGGGPGLPPAGRATK